MNQYRGYPPPRSLAEAFISLTTPLERQLRNRSDPLTRTALAEMRLMVAFHLRLEEVEDVLGDRLRPPDVSAARRRQIAFIFQDPEVQERLSRYVSETEHAPVRPLPLADAA